MAQQTLIDKTISILKNGGVIIYPTDTIYGIGCDILSEKAVEKIYKLKKRDRSKPLILLVSDIDMLKQYIKGIHPRVETLLSFHKRPLTIIYKGNDLIPDYLMGKNKTIGIRVVRHSFCQAVIKKLGRPITSTSANISGQTFPIVAEDLDKKLVGKVDLTIPSMDQNESSDQPSVVAKFNKEGELIILRD